MRRHHRPVLRARCCTSRWPCAMASTLDRGVRGAPEIHATQPPRARGLAHSRRRRLQAARHRVRAPVSALAGAHRVRRRPPRGGLRRSLTVLLDLAAATKFFLGPAVTGTCPSSLIPAGITRRAVDLGVVVPPKYFCRARRSSAMIDPTARLSGDLWRNRRAVGGRKVAPVTHATVQRSACGSPTAWPNCRPSGPTVPRRRAAQALTAARGSCRRSAG